MLNHRSDPGHLLCEMTSSFISILQMNSLKLNGDSMGVKWLFVVLGLVSGQAKAEPGQSEPRAKLNCGLDRSSLTSQMRWEEAWPPCPEQDLGVEARGRPSVKPHPSEPRFSHQKARGLARVTYGMSTVTFQDPPHGGKRGDCPLFCSTDVLWLITMAGLRRNKPEQVFVLQPPYALLPLGTQAGESRLW